LQEQNTVDLPPPAVNDDPPATAPAAPLRSNASASAASSAPDDSPAAHALRSDDPTVDIMPMPRGWGFFAFLACALTAGFVAIEQNTAPVPLNSNDTPAQTSTRLANVQGSIPLRTPSSSMTVEAKTTAAYATPSLPVSYTTQPMATDVNKHETVARDAMLGTVTFQSRSVAASEKSVAAVFIVMRTQPTTGRAFAKWAVKSGSADAGIDFSDASGTIRFATGQQQRAIYVPLRNDLLQEPDETFRVCIRSPQQARLGANSCVEATIVDDDTINPLG
jgi:hypothetical protein